MITIGANRIEREPFIYNFILLFSGVLELSYDMETFLKQEEVYSITGDVYELSESEREYFADRFKSGIVLPDSTKDRQDSDGFIGWLYRCVCEERVESQPEFMLRVSDDDESDRGDFYKLLAIGAETLVRDGMRVSDADLLKLGLQYATAYGQARGFIKTGTNVTVDNSQKVIMNEATAALEKAKELAGRLVGKK